VSLLNQRFTPTILAGDDGIVKLAHLIHTCFQMDGHHVQFNVVDTPTLRRAQRDSGTYRGLMVRVAGSSGHCCNLGRELQEEIITRRAHGGF
jgi:formate C-acetyltransferase